MDEMEHAWTLTATDVYLGWTENIAIRGRAHSRVVPAIEEVTDRLPYPMVGLDYDNGGEFINHLLAALVRRGGDLHDPREGAHLQRQRPRGAEERPTSCASRPSATATTPPKSSPCWVSCGGM